MQLPYILQQQERVFMADFCLYADESGKLQQSEYTSLCGFVTHLSEWDRFSQDWENCRMAWGVPGIHMRCVMKPERPKCEPWTEIKNKWGVTWDKRREQMLGEFAALVDQSHLVCKGVVVDAEHFRQLPDCDFKRTMNNPLYLAFYHIVRDSLDHIDLVYPNRFRQLAVVVDDDEQYSMKCYELLNGMRKQFPDEINKRVDQLCFGRDAGYSGLQAADMIAYEARNRMIDMKNNPDSEPNLLYRRLTRGGLHRPKLYTPEYLDMLCGLKPIPNDKP